MPGGKEGPAFLIGGTLAYVVGNKLFKLNKNDLSLCVTIGSASATSAIFSAPLGGTLFASEVPFKRDIDMDIYLPAFIASIISVLTFFILGKGFLHIQGLNVNFLLNSIEIISLNWVFLSFIFGIIVGLASFSYIRIYNSFNKIFDKIGDTWKQIVVASILGSLVILLSGIIFPERSEFLETGFNLLNTISNDIESYGFNFLLILFFFKALILLFLISGGNSIGIFSPSLVLGGILGLLFSIFAGLTAYSDIFFLLGMVGALAGTAKTPISSMILILEMTGLPQLILYMAIVSSVAYVVSGDTGLYSTQLVDRREALKQMLESKNYLSIVPIESIMSETVIKAYPDQTVSEIKSKFLQTNKHSFPIVNKESNELVGIISFDDIKNKDDSLIIGDIMIKEVLYLTTDFSLQQALQEVLRTGVEHYPIVQNAQSKVLIGFITLRDILNSYFEQEKLFAKNF
jgi:CIC family chloride channel protein